VSGSVRASCGHWDVRPLSKCATCAKWGRVPSLGSPPHHVTLVKSPSSLVNSPKLPVDWGRRKNMFPTCSLVFQKNRKLIK
jgi:hypothetical protein